MFRFLVSPGLLGFFLLVAFIGYLALLRISAGFVRARKTMQGGPGPIISASFSTRMLAAFEIESATEVAAGLLASLALAASAYAYFVEELTRKASVDFDVACSTGPDQRLRIVTVSQQAIGSCVLKLWPTAIKAPALDNTPIPPKPQPQLKGYSFACTPWTPYDEKLQLAIFAESPELGRQIATKSLEIVSLDATIEYNWPPQSDKKDRDSRKKDVQCH